MAMRTIGNMCSHRYVATTFFCLIVLQLDNGVASEHEVPKYMNIGMPVFLMMKTSSGKLVRVADVTVVTCACSNAVLSGTNHSAFSRGS